jgi:hypothetical protein
MKPYRLTPNESLRTPEVLPGGKDPGARKTVRRSQRGPGGECRERSIVASERIQRSPAAKSKKRNKSFGKSKLESKGLSQTVEGLDDLEKKIRKSNMEIPPDPFPSGQGSRYGEVSDPTGVLLWQFLPVLSAVNKISLRRF